MNILIVILYLTNFLRTIGIIVLIYFGLKFVVRLLFPIVVKKAVNNMQARQSPDNRERKREGDVTIEKDRPEKNRSHSGEGEYVDFEEIE